MDIPTSMMTLVGEQVLRFGTSHNRERFFIDIPAAQRNNRRTRYGYTVAPARVVSSLNLDNLLGRYVTDVYDGGTEGKDIRKLVFETNPTGSQVLYTIIFLETTDEYWLLEEQPETYWELEESREGWLLEESPPPEDIEIIDVTLPRNVFQNTDSEDNFFEIQEDDFEEPDNE